MEEIKNLCEEGTCDECKAKAPVEGSTDAPATDEATTPAVEAETSNTDEATN